MAQRDSVYEQFRRATTRALLLWVLEQCGGDRTRAAKTLGLSRAGFYKLLHQHGILGSREGIGTGGPDASGSALGGTGGNPAGVSGSGASGSPGRRRGPRRKGGAGATGAPPGAGGRPLLPSEAAEDWEEYRPQG